MYAAWIVAALLGGPATCSLPVYLEDGTARCADAPAATAFGKVTWSEDGRVVTMPARLVDLERTMARHRRAPVRASFSMPEAGVRGGGPLPPRGELPSPRPIGQDCSDDEETPTVRHVVEIVRRPPPEPLPPLRMSAQTEMRLRKERRQLLKEIQRLSLRAPRIRSGSVEEAIVRARIALELRHEIQQRWDRVQEVEELLDR